MVKIKSKIVSARVKPEMRIAMENWADQHDLPLSWVLKKSIEIGWPLFQKQGIISKDTAAA